MSESVLGALCKERIFFVERRGVGFRLTEACDYYYFADLTKDQMITLGCEILTMAGCRVNVEDTCK